MEAFFSLRLHFAPVNPNAMKHANTINSGVWFFFLVKSVWQTLRGRMLSIFLTLDVCFMCFSIESSYILYTHMDRPFER